MRLPVLNKALSTGATESLAEANKVTEIQDKTEKLESPVCSYNEWDPLEVRHYNLSIYIIMIEIKLLLLLS